MCRHEALRSLRKTETLLLGRPKQFGQLDEVSQSASDGTPLDLPEAALRKLPQMFNTSRIAEFSRNPTFSIAVSLRRRSHELS
jgi:hypothetical protein